MLIWRIRSEGLGSKGLGSEGIGSEGLGSERLGSEGLGSEGWGWNATYKGHWSLKCTDQGYDKRMRVLSKLFVLLRKKNICWILSRKSTRSQTFQKILDDFQQKSYEIKAYQLTPHLK